MSYSVLFRNTLLYGFVPFLLINAWVLIYHFALMPFINNNLVFAWAVIVLGLLELAYFFYMLLKKIIEAARKNTPMYIFLVFLFLNMLNTIYAFTWNYWLVYSSNPKSFEGVNPQFTTFEQVFEFYYFSSLTFSYFGYGEIMPTTIPTKLLVMMEIGLSFTTMIFVLADFVGLRESLLQENENLHTTNHSRNSH
jgi:hypothetical protein